MARAQGSLEYLIIIAIVLAVSAVVISYSTGILGGGKSSISVTSCKQAAVDCKAAKMLSSTDPCLPCDTACKDSGGVELFDGATYCCTMGQPDMIYLNSPGCGGGYTTTTCSDGTPKATCSDTKPKYCDLNLQLVDDCVTCGCPTGYTCNTVTKTCYLTCSDGTAYGQCSVTKPKYCSSGTLIDNCVTCGCPGGYSCNTVTGSCAIPCSDGTLSGYCSSTKPKYCDNGVLIDDCVTCGCPAGYTCNTVTKVCGCSDGTAPGVCSPTKPKYCSAGTLINNCTNCGCPTNQACNATDKSCYTPLVMKELFYDEFSTMNAWTGDIGSLGWHANLTSGYNNSNSAFVDNYTTHTITHTQSTSDATKINVSFWANNLLQDTGEVLRMEWFDGTSWTSMGNLPNNKVWTYYSYNLPSSAENKANFAIKFLCYDWHTTDALDWCQVDTLRIRALRPGCSDGTLLGQCSSTKPLYCDTGQLVDRCSSCGCPSPGAPYSCCCDDTSRGTCTNRYSCDGTSCTTTIDFTSCSVCPSGCCFGHTCSSVC